MAHIFYGDFQGSPNLGLYGIATNTYCLVGKSVPESVQEEFKDIFKVPVYSINIAGSSMLGILLVANKNKLLVPHIADEAELRQLRKWKIPFEIIETNLTALGNNILANDEGAIINPDFSDEEQKKIEKALGVKTIRSSIADQPTAGSLGITNRKGCLLHHEITKEELELVQKTLKVECLPSTVNLGSPHVHSAIILNDFGIAIGDQSSGYEVNEAETVFGFL